MTTFFPDTWPEVAEVSVKVMSGGKPLGDSLDWVAQEVPVALEFNGISHAVMLATPADYEDFALGFALTEGIIDSHEQFFGAEAVIGGSGVSVQINIASSCFARLKEKRRNLTGRTGCGVCGTDSLDHVLRSLPRASNCSTPVQASAIRTALMNIQTHQRLQQQTGATHAAAWFDCSGQLQLLREDVGRHNALDKLIGAGLRNKHADWSKGFLIVTSRASMEMVQKALIAGFNLVIAISAPTQLAIDIASQHGLGLIGFARPEKWTVYANAHLIASEVSEQQIS